MFNVKSTIMLFVGLGVLGILLLGIANTVVRLSTGKELDVDRYGILIMGLVMVVAVVGGFFITF